MAALGAEAVFFQAGSAAARTGRGAFGHSSPLQGRHVSFDLPYDRALAICSTLELVELGEHSYRFAVEAAALTGVVLLQHLAQ